MTQTLTIAQRARVQGFNASLQIRGRTLCVDGPKGPERPCKVLFQSLPDTDPSLRISDDHREMCKVSLLKPGPGWLREETICEPGTDNSWEVVKEDDNHSDILVGYELRQNTEHDE